MGIPHMAQAHFSPTGQPKEASEVRPRTNHLTDFDSHACGFGISALDGEHRLHNISRRQKSQKLDMFSSGSSCNNFSWVHMNKNYHASPRSYVTHYTASLRQSKASCLRQLETLLDRLVCSPIDKILRHIVGRHTWGNHPTSVAP